ncbi:uncharacterized protein LOC110020701 [Phalaenopsis equestris]|uniref:uncharacterized protein LOC110020701 n=1 Tax=Phalaenopsis equestris TaxID=78828 RepID=UPI0009E5BA4B|nr:uncharacterized protein LOC110020701 [Phalaenopsis equestris]
MRRIRLSISPNPLYCSPVSTSGSISAFPLSPLESFRPALLPFVSKPLEALSRRQLRVECLCSFSNLYFYLSSTEYICPRRVDVGSTTRSMKVILGAWERCNNSQNWLVG